MNINPNSETNQDGGRLLMWFTFIFYALFTLLPDSSSVMVQWPWVFCWQIALLCPVLWLLGRLWLQRKIQPLGQGLDWIIGLMVIGLVISTLFAVFPNQARWYGWAVLCVIAALYAVNDYLNTSERRYLLLISQGYLNIAFMIWSLWLWTTQTLFPELNRIHGLQKYGVKLSFDFSVLELRNWAPIGHQNYVAGYLLLAIPVLISLTILDPSQRRWLWGMGVGLGIIDLYTTSSRGGWLGLGGLLIFGLGILLWKSTLPRLWLGLGGLFSVIILFGLAMANNRLRSLIGAVLRGETGGELAYRLINLVIGWKMGSDYPFSGIGLGGVPLLYQNYRPIWAGQESELAYQLHSTPAQMWAELGLWGILPVLLGIICLIYSIIRHNSSQSKLDQVLLWSLVAGLWGYSLMAITDYQLDNLSISGTLVIYIACLASILRINSEVKSCFFPFPVALFYAGIGLILAIIIWLIPIHRAWQLSSQGFMALAEKQLQVFVENLTQAQKLAHWESYYPYQLGWNLGDIALKTQNLQQQPNLLNAAIQEFQRANGISPYQEFGRTNLGWLLLQYNPEEASQSFTKSVQLVPAKRGVMYGLGLSLLRQRKTDLGIEAIALEAVRDPLFITSPRWRDPQLQSLYNQLLQKTIAIYTELLNKYEQPGTLNTLLHQQRGGMFWWQGNLTAAHQDLDSYGTSFSKSILAITEGESLQSVISDFPASPTRLLLQAYSDSQQRTTLIQQAWIEEQKIELPVNLADELLNTMAQSQTFEQWVKQTSPVLSYRRQRSGFGVLSRHIDGTIPLDFYPVVDNLVMTTWLNEMLPVPVYQPELDLALQPLQENLWKQF